LLRFARNDKWRLFGNCTEFNDEQSQIVCTFAIGSHIISLMASFTKIGCPSLPHFFHSRLQINWLFFLVIILRGE
jgi:hypothetical protein